MNKFLFFLSALFLFQNCNESKQKKSIVKKIEIINDREKTKKSLSIKEEMIDSLKQIKIHWDSIPICKLPIDTDMIENGEIKLKKYCCSPNCHQEFNLNELDVMFSVNTEYETKANHYDNGHPSKKQGYFGLRLPDIDHNRVLLFSYYDGEASDYKTCTIELQIFNDKNVLVDKMIIQDGLYYECGWKRTFSISKNYSLTVNDLSYCAELGDVNVEKYDEIEIVSRYKISNEERIKKISESILKPLK